MVSTPDVEERIETQALDWTWGHVICCGGSTAAWGNAGRLGRQDGRGSGTGVGRCWRGRACLWGRRGVCGVVERDEREEVARVVYRRRANG